MTSAFCWLNSVSLCPVSFCTPRPNLPVIREFNISHWDFKFPLPHFYFIFFCISILPSVFWSYIWMLIYKQDLITRIGHGFFVYVCLSFCLNSLILNSYNEVILLNCFSQVFILSVHSMGYAKQTGNSRWKER